MAKLSADEATVAATPSPANDNATARCARVLELRFWRAQKEPKGLGAMGLWEKINRELKRDITALRLDPSLSLVEQIYEATHDAFWVLDLLELKGAARFPNQPTPGWLRAYLARGRDTVLKVWDELDEIEASLARGEA